VSYRLQVQTLFQLSVDPVFRAAFRDDPAAAVPGLTADEGRELLKLPECRRPAASDSDPAGPEGAQGTTAFMRTGIQARCRTAMPRTYAALQQIADRRGHSVEIDLLRTPGLWKPLPPEYHRDGVSPNPAVHWTETARVLQMANRVFFQFYNYALAVHERDPQEVPWLGQVARFEFETLARRVPLYRRFVAPGPVALRPGPQSRLVLSVYAELGLYCYRVGDPVPVATPVGVVFLYNGERLRVLQMDAESAAAVALLDGRVPLDEFKGRTRQVLEGLAGQGALTAAS
jgi:hypothetical protein